MRRLAPAAIAAMLILSTAARAQITGIVTRPGGASGQIQYNNNGLFGGMPAFTTTTLAGIGASTAALAAGGATTYVTITGDTMTGDLNGKSVILTGGVSVSTVSASTVTVTEALRLSNNKSIFWADSLGDFQSMIKLDGSNKLNIGNVSGYDVLLGQSGGVKVSVGDTTPTQTFDVNGTIGISDVQALSITGGNFVVGNPAGGGTQNVWLAANGDYRLKVQGDGGVSIPGNITTSSASFSDPSETTRMAADVAIGGSLNASGALRGVADSNGKVAQISHDGTDAIIESSYLGGTFPSGVKIGYTTTGGVNTTGIRISNAGLVGINHLTPANPFHVNGDGSGNIAYFQSGLANSATVYFQADSSVGYIGTLGSDALVLRTNSTDRARIESGGAVAIGTNTATAFGANVKLHVNSSANLDETGAMAVISNSFSETTVGRGGMLSLGGTYNGGSPTIFGTVAGFKESATASNSAGYLLFATPANGGLPVERMRITSVGNVNIAGSTFTVNTTGVVSALSQPHTRNAVPANVLTALTFTKVFFSAPAAGAAAGGMWGGASSSGTFTIPAGAGGDYSARFKGYVNSAGVWIYEFRVNGVAVETCQDDNDAMGAHTFQCDGTLIVAAGDTVEVYINSATSGTFFANGLTYDNFVLRKEL